MEHFDGALNDEDERPWIPVDVKTRKFTAPSHPVAYDCVKLMLIRSGTVLLHAKDRCRLLRPGDLVVLCAVTLCGALPRNEVEVSTAYVDPDYLLDQIAWRHAEVLPDRYAAAEVIERTYAEHVQVHHLGNDLARDFGAVFDALEASVAEVTRERGFYPVQAAFSLLLEQMDRIVPFDPIRTMSTPSRLIEPQPSRAKYAPVREDLLALFSAVKSDLSRPWTVEEMAHVAHLSPRHLTRVFLDAMGRTPRAAVSAMRAKEMCRLLRETDLTIEQAGHVVGWHSRSYARQAFAVIVGMTPSRYRAQARGRYSDMHGRNTDESVG
ncbi:hypothetical protein GCM10010910_03860 [Microbacterium nanhaiense]|uniref:HTH araC/xylS-type domain-containing protein n=1 Tax=Microbacterium nanhaiense TaxID=1301026 RepID=A0ABQ2MXX5_9MICO|nr:AraC family transcriptional regulator [Microbacterium nanhaiense]GGO59865.1 hypothetical protein GCM10010910_03860 [Microbacterium nanhaiense]